MRIRALPVVAVCLLVWTAQAADPRPTDTEAAGELARTRAVAADYVKHMPDFICTQTIRRSIHLTLPKNWIPKDVLTLTLRYAGGTEDRQLIGHDGPAGGLENVGEFGGMLESVFDPGSRADFRWESWKMVAGRPVAVYSYRVSQEHSSYMLSFDPGGYMHRVTVAYQGTVEVDRESGGILHLVYEAEDVPKDFPMQSASTAVDYGFVEVAGRRYLLPVKSQIETETDGIRSRNISEFTNYRRFSADSTLTFTDTVQNQ